MLQRRPRTLLAILVSASLPRAAPAAASNALVFVVSAHSRTTALSSSDLRRIYLGQITRWPDHRQILLAVRPSSTVAGQAFFDRVVQMSEIDFSQRWLGIVFRGEAATSPRLLDSGQAVARFLSQNKDGLAYALLRELDSAEAAVRPLTIDGARAGDPAYPFPIR